MTTTSQLRIDSLKLTNFRCFDQCEISFNPQLTALVAENGRGKTAILDAVGIALGTFVDGLSGSQHFHKFDRSDIRLVQAQNRSMTPVLPTEFVANGQIFGQDIEWSRALGGYGLRARTTSQGAQKILSTTREFQSLGSQTLQAEFLLPLVSFYGTGRLWSEHRLTEERRQYALAAGGRLAGYTDCLSSSSSFKGFVAWYESKMNEIADPRFSTESSRSVALIRAVQEAVRVVLNPTGWTSLNWDPERRILVVEHETHGRLPLNTLSDGVRNMIALIADVARRCATLNPQLGEDAARHTPGVLIIDEVDMHLHPRWQQQLMETLRRAFPSLQMVVSTHSPHVLSTVEAESIRTIRFQNGRASLSVPPFQTRGVESADVLAKVMDVDPIPQIEPARWLSEYRALIQMGEHESDSGRELFDKLVAHFGQEHPLMEQIDTLRRLQEFRRESGIRPGQGN